MPVKSNQRSLDFPVRKSAAVTRSRSKRIAAKENTTHRINKDGCSPVKRTRRNNKENLENEPIHSKIPPGGLNVVDLASPNRSICANILTPSKQNSQNQIASPLRSPVNILGISKSKTPSKIHSLTCSPIVERPEALKAEPAPDAALIYSKARVLDFSLLEEKSHPAFKLNRDHDDLRRSPDEKEKTVLATPLRQKSRLLDTPTRQSPRLNKQVVEKCSPVKSGVKNLSSKFDEQPVTPVKTPSKSNENVELRRSPRKHLSSNIEVLQSPRKAALQEPDVRRSPRKHNTPLRLAKQDSLCYQKAKRALNIALPEKLLCREKQYKEVNDFLDKCLDKKQSGSLYISGAPGTGKTAVLSHTLKRLKEEKKIQVIYVNCMSVKNSQAIFNRVLGDFTGRDSNLSCKEACKQLEKCVTSKGPMVCMIMDEVDQLDSKNQEVLYTMFEWPHLNKSRLVLVGIANALDLTDRVLPRLQSMPKCKPKLMNFPPYSKDQIVTIITDRLSKVEVEGQQVLDASAIQMCARKVAAVAGDMRKALDVCRRAIEMVESEVKRQQILARVTSPSKAAPSANSVPKRIGVAHIMKCVNEVYGARTSVQSGQDQTIPLQQKLAVCTLLLTLRKGKSKEVGLGKLHENYTRVCRRQEVVAVDQGEFMSLCGLVEARGIMGVKKAKDTRQSKVWLKIDEGELERTLKDKTLVSSVLQNGI